MYNFCDDDDNVVIEDSPIHIEEDINVVSMQLALDRQAHVDSQFAPEKYVPKSWIDEVPKIEQQTSMADKIIASLRKMDPALLKGVTPRIRSDVSRIVAEKLAAPEPTEIIHTSEINSSIALGALRDAAAIRMARYVPSLIRTLRGTCKSLLNVMNQKNVGYPFNRRGVLSDIQVMQIRGLMNVLTQDNYINPAIRLPMVSGSDFAILFKIILQLIITIDEEEELAGAPPTQSTRSTQSIPTPSRISLIVVPKDVTREVDLIIATICCASMRSKITCAYELNKSHGKKTKDITVDCYNSIMNGSYQKRIMIIKNSHVDPKYPNINRLLAEYSFKVKVQMFDNSNRVTANMHFDHLLYDVKCQIPLVASVSSARAVKWIHAIANQQTLPLPQIEIFKVDMGKFKPLSTRNVRVINILCGIHPAIMKAVMFHHHYAMGDNEVRYIPPSMVNRTRDTVMRRVAKCDLTNKHGAGKELMNLLRERRQLIVLTVKHAGINVDELSKVDHLGRPITYYGTHVGRFTNDCTRFLACQSPSILFCGVYNLFSDELQYQISKQHIPVVFIDLPDQAEYRCLLERLHSRRLGYIVEVCFIQEHGRLFTGNSNTVAKNYRNNSVRYVQPSWNPTQVPEPVYADNHAVKFRGTHVVTTLKLDDKRGSGTARVRGNNPYKILITPEENLALCRARKVANDAIKKVLSTTPEFVWDEFRRTVDKIKEWQGPTKYSMMLPHSIASYYDPAMISHINGLSIVDILRIKYYDDDYNPRAFYDKVCLNFGLTPAEDDGETIALIMEEIKVDLVMYLNFKENMKMSKVEFDAHINPSWPTVIRVLCLLSHRTSSIGEFLHFLYSHSTVATRNLIKIG